MNPRQKGWLDEVVHAYAAKHRPEVIEQVSNRKPWFILARLTSHGQVAWRQVRALLPHTNSEFLLSTPIPRMMLIMSMRFGVISRRFRRDLLADHYQKDHKPEKGWVSMFDGKTLRAGNQ